MRVNFIPFGCVFTYAISEESGGRRKALRNGKQKPSGRSLPRKLSRMGRRGFMKAAANLGISGIALRYLQRNSKAAENMRDEIPRVSALIHTNHDEVVQGAKPEREAIYYTIPREEWEYVEGVDDAREQIERTLVEIELSDNVEVWVREVSVGSHRERGISVETMEYKRGDSTIAKGPSVEKLEEKLPATIEGIAGRGTDKSARISDIPVVVSKAKKSQEYYYDSDYKPEIPGGCKIETEVRYVNGTAYGPYGHTVGTPVFDHQQGENAWVTDGHTFTYSPKYGEAHQPRHNQYGLNHIGNVDGNRIKDDWTWDAAVVNKANDNDVLYSLADENGGTKAPPVIGTVPKDEIKDHYYNTSYVLHRQGMRTGHDLGYITGYSSTQFSTDTMSDEGDSGGPHYKKESSDGYDWFAIAGIHWGSHYYDDQPGSGDDSVATMMVEIEDEFNLSV